MIDESLGGGWMHPHIFDWHLLITVLSWDELVGLRTNIQSSNLFYMVVLDRCTSVYTVYAVVWESVSSFGSNAYFLDKEGNRSRVRTHRRCKGSRLEEILSMKATMRGDRSCVWRKATLVVKLSSDECHNSFSMLFILLSSTYRFSFQPTLAFPSIPHSYHHSKPQCLSPLIPIFPASRTTTPTPIPLRSWAPVTSHVHHICRRHSHEK